MSARGLTGSLGWAYHLVPPVRGLEWREPRIRLPASDRMIMNDSPQIGADS